MDNKLSLGINISIILTLTILAGLLFLPLKLLLDTNYKTEINNKPTLIKDNSKKIIDFKKLKLCPGEYKYWMESIFFSNYDDNCTYSNLKKTSNIETALKQKLKVDETDNENSTSANTSTVPGSRIIRPKSVPVTDYILVIMLTVSIVGAFIEFLRIRFTNVQDESSSVEGIASRRQSIVALMLPRKCAREPLKAQMSLDVPGSQRSTVRVSGSRAPPLIRRSSFPVYFNLDSGGSDSLTPPRSPRRPSIVNADSEIGTCTPPVLHHRSRLIRRH